MTWPPVLPGILFRYENRSGRQHWSSQSLPPSAKVTRVQLRRHAGGKALRWLWLSAAHVLIRPRSSPGSTCGYVDRYLGAYERPGINLGESLIRA